MLQLLVHTAFKFQMFLRNLCSCVCCGMFNIRTAYLVDMFGLRTRAARTSSKWASVTCILPGFPFANAAWSENIVWYPLLVVNADTRESITRNNAHLDFLLKTPFWHLLMQRFRWKDLEAQVERIITWSYIVVKCGQLHLAFFPVPFGSWGIFQ
jgi:hypothetical protein